MKHTRLLVYVAGLVLAVGLWQCGSPRRAQPLTVKGSDTMVILVQRWAEVYMAAHPGAVVQVTGGGSGTGFAALQNGTTDICQASRPIKDEENENLRSKYGEAAHELVVARDGLSLYVNAASPISALSLEQVKAIYSGQFTNWRQVGGPDAPIVLYSRENNSGTYAFFKDHVLGGGDFAANAQTLPGTAAVVNAVAQDVNGIGYGGEAYAKGVKLLPLKKDESSPAIAPAEATVRDGSYPLARALYFYTRKAPTGDAKAFLDFCLSPEGQKIVGEVGYFPVQ